MQAYCDSKFHNVLLAFSVSRSWPETLSNYVEPGWVATKMGGKSATDDLGLAPRTQAWLATGAAFATRLTDEYFYHQRHVVALKITRNTWLQERFLTA